MIEGREERFYDDWSVERVEMRMGSEERGKLSFEGSRGEVEERE